jgi:hypothetical protein
MEITKREIEIVERTAEEAREKEFVELSQLQLVLVGGGSGEVIFG